MRIERDGAAPKASAALLVLLAALAGAPAMAAESTDAAPVLRNQVDAMTRAALQRAGEGALRRLEDPECQQVFTDFRDAEGRPLREKLEAAGQTSTRSCTPWVSARTLPRASRSTSASPAAAADARVTRAPR